MVVAVTGGRNHDLSPPERSWLEERLRELSPIELRHGGAPGVDTVAGIVATRMGVPVRVFHAEWQTYGNAAGPIRNARMLKGSNILLGFDGGKGTANCIKTARGLGIEVLLFARE